MNPLGQMPAASSAGTSLNSIDLTKLLRTFLVAAIGALLTFIPTWMGATYVWHGHDLTAVVYAGLTFLSEVCRRWLAGQPKAA